LRLHQPPYEWCFAGFTPQRLINAFSSSIRTGLEM
jgi:hypothetical protein